ATDLGSGMDYVAFGSPTAAAGWAGGGSKYTAPYEVPYAWTSATTGPNQLLWTALDVAGNSTNGSYEFRADATAPTGGSITYGNGVQTTAAISVVPGTDAESGIASWDVERRDVPTTSPGTCGTSWGAWSPVATGSTSFTDSTVASSTCYQYRLLVNDNVGNQTLVTGSSTLITGSPGVVITETGTSTTVTENGATDTYTVKLRSAPTSNVTISIAGTSQVSASPASLTFTPADWSSPQTVTVTAVDDARDESDPLPTVTTHSVSTSDPSYSPLVGTPIVQVVNTLDDDESAVVVSSVSGTLAEGSAAVGTYAVVLNSQPQGSVTVAVTPDAQSSVTPSTLTFTAADWSTAKTVSVRALDDSDLEGTHQTTISHVTSSTADPLYNGYPTASLAASITDDEQARIVVSLAPGAEVDESNAADVETVSVQLASRPAGVVTVTAAPVAGQLAVSAATLSFSPATWNTPQSITVTAVNDRVAEPNPHAARLTLSPSATDTRWAASGDTVVSIGVRDDDIAALSARPAQGVDRTSDGAIALAEGQTSGVGIAIRAGGDPTSDIVIVPRSEPSRQLVFSPASVTIPAGSHDQVVTVMVRAANDDVEETAIHDASVAWTVRTGDALYAGAALEDIRFGITDDDAPRITRETTPDPSPPTNDGGGARTPDPAPPTGGGSTQPTNPAPTGDQSGETTTKDPVTPTPSGDSGGNENSGAKDGAAKGAGTKREQPKRQKPKTGMKAVADRTKQWAKEHTGAAVTGASAAVAAGGAVAAKVAGGAAVKGLGSSMLGEPSSMVRRVVQSINPTGGEHGPHRPGSRTVKKVWQRARKGRGAAEQSGTRGPSLRRPLRDLLPPEPDPGFELDLEAALDPSADAGFELDLDQAPGRDAGFNIDLDDYDAA
ncbi:MAG: hypothetical protein JWM86_1430, partial [Thermoleophilia bacterium]|nr:hypothetical protein [Thermoleophilia bacterium]